MRFTGFLKSITGLAHWSPVRLLLRSSITVLPFLSLHLALPLAGAEEAAPPEMRLLFSEACVREPEDQAWMLRVSGRVPSLAGCYLLVHDSDGKLIFKKHIPHGDYSGGRTLELEVPKDGRAGDYRIIVVGREPDIVALGLPLTSLPLEVYGRSLFATRSKGPFWFVAEPGSARVQVSGNSAAVPILQETGKELRQVSGPLEPGERYAVDPAKTFYFKADPGVYLSPSPERCFVPDAGLTRVSWWRLTGGDSGEPN